MAAKKATSKKKTTKKATKKSTKKAKKAAVANPWSMKDVAYLKANYKGKTATQISKAIGRTVNAIRAKAAGLKLKKGVAKKAMGKKATKR